jgi:hypothetical protein
MPLGTRVLHIHNRHSILQGCEPRCNLVQTRQCHPARNPMSVYSSPVVQVPLPYPTNTLQKGQPGSEDTQTVQYQYMRFTRLC